MVKVRARVRARARARAKVRGCRVDQGVGWARAAGACISSPISSSICSAFSASRLISASYC